jgi:hypothetical protein
MTAFADFRCDDLVSMGDDEGAGKVLCLAKVDGIQLENTKLILLMRSIYSFYTPFLCFEIQDLKYKI